MSQKTVKRPRERGRKYPPAAVRGYGRRHKAERKRWQIKVDAGEAVCARCGRWIAPRSKWDLGHHDRDRNIYVGPEHPRCNRGASRRKRNPSPLKSRVW